MSYQLNQSANNQTPTGYATLGMAPSDANAPQTDMQTHIHRARTSAHQLAAIHDILLGLIGRLYGEGQSGKEQASAPHAAGLNNELNVALSDIEAVAEKVGMAVSRLSGLA
jgi:hypothetical protein